MRRKSPLFLLEIVIAIFLVGIFSVYFLRSSVHTLYQERKALLALEFEKEYDLKRMDLLVQNWLRLDQLPGKSVDAKEELYQCKVDIGGKSYVKTRKFKVWCKHHESAHDLIIKEDATKYHFLVLRQAQG